MSKRALVWLICALLAGCAAESTRGGVVTDRDPATAADGGVDSPSDPGDNSNPPPSTGDGSTPNNPGNGTCEAVSVDAQRIPANVMIVLDASGSMFVEGIFGIGEENNWTPAVEAVESVTADLEDDLNFGLLTFPLQGTTCEVGDVAVAPMAQTAAQIASALAGEPSLKTGGNTPTASALDIAGEALKARTEKPAILLVTDGLPNCDDYGPDDQGPSDIPSVNTIARLASEGIPTYVLGLQVNAMGTTTLDAMAVAGGTGATEHIKVEDVTLLGEDLKKVANSIASCSYELEMAPPDIRYVRVQVDGVDVPHGSAGGAGYWELTGDKTIELRGESCDAIQDGGDHQVDITVECELVLI